MSSRPLSRRCLISGSISKRRDLPVAVADLLRGEVDLGARRRRRPPGTSSSSSTTGSRPIFVLLDAKMSANDGATIALKP